MWVDSVRLLLRKRLTDTSSADCAPKQLFQLFRCSAWLILHEQSTGLFIPKRSCSRASPLRGRTMLPLWESPVFRSASSDCAPKQLFQLFRCSAWLILHEQSTGLFIPKRSCSRASPLHVRTVLPLRESSVFRSAYFPETVHRTVSSKTLDLQGFAPPGEPPTGSLSICARIDFFCERWYNMRVFLP